MTAIETSRRITVELNGTTYEREVEARRLLIHFIRDDLEQTGSHIGCDTGNCGACSVLVDGVLVKSCLMLAVQADGASVETVEGLAPDGELTPLQQAFHEQHALQCGYCTPGMLMAATALLAKSPRADRGRDPQGPPGQHLPLHRLLEHHQGGPGRLRSGGRRNERDDRRAGEDVEVEAPAEQQRWAGQSVPRKEDRRLVQGQGVFVDDIKRHNMGFAAYVRSPYAHAVIKSVDVSAALAVPGVYGTLTGDEVATLTDPFFQLSTAPGNEIKDYALAVGRARFVGDPVAIVVAETRELARDAAELVEVDYEPLPAITDARHARDEGVPVIHPDAGSNLVWEGTYEWGNWDDAVGEADQIVKISELHFDRFNSTPLECDGALVEYNRGTGQWTMYTNNQFPGFAAIMMAPAIRHRHRQAALRHAGHRRRVRQQDHLASPARRDVPARPEAEPRDPVDRVAHRVPSLDVARQRALVPRHRGRRQGRRDAARLQDEGARRRRRLHPLRAARRRDLGAGDTRHVPLAEHPARLHAGGHEQGAVLAEPRLLAHAAPLVHRARDRHRRVRARPRSGRGAQAQLHPGRRDAVHDAERLRLRLGRLRRRCSTSRST